MVWDIISMSIIALYIYPWLRLANDKRYLAMAIGMIVAQLSTKVIKYATAPLGGPFLRPQGARNCGILCQDGNVSGKPGFVSGHMTDAAFFFTYLWLINPQPNLIVLWICGVFIFAMARYKKKCHNIFQIVSGTIYGTLFAIIWFRHAKF